MTLVTDYYRSVLEKEHSISQWGVASVYYAPRIFDILSKYNLNELLDYGSGVGNLEKVLKKLNPNIVVHKYEPGIPQWSTSPKPCKMVACIDVIEHVEPDCLNNVLDDLERVIEKYAFISISTVPATRVLNNGWNAHICLKKAEEWKEIFEKRFRILASSMSEYYIDLELCKKDLNEDI
jgi:2-polyprenyl-3-methyl-5-hydroxy-6-metoxy-1,4-benzoquinol methylase